MTWGRGVLCDVVHGNKRQMFASGALNMDTRDTTTRGCTFNNIENTTKHHFYIVVKCQ